MLTPRGRFWPGVARSMLVSLCVGLAVLGLSACSARQLLVQGIAAELATQGQAPEDDLQLAREASAFYLKLSESVLREAPGNLPLAEAVAAGFTQYAYAFVSADADRSDARDARVAHTLRQRAARLYRRAHQHAMRALEQRQPGFRRALEARSPAEWPQPAPDMVALVYWGAASWGGWISLSKDDPEVVADLPLANRLAALAYDRLPAYGDGALASLMGTFEAARPGGSMARATAYFDHGIALGAGRNAGAFMAKAEGIALPAGDRAGFEALLRQALRASETRRDLQNEAMRERALWLLESLDDLF